MFMSHHQNSGTAHKSFGNMTELKYLEPVLTNLTSVTEKLRAGYTLEMLVALQFRIICVSICYAKA
jgi:hypothetical protein